MSDKFTGKDPIRPSAELLEALRQWQLPQVKDEQPKRSDKTNVMGLKKPSSIPEPEIEEIEIPQLPTAEEVEEIRASAYEDGLVEGKKAGHEQGLEEGTKEGYEKGFEDGKTAGYTEGFGSGEEAVTELQQQWNTLVEMLNSPLKAVDEQAEKQLLAMVAQLAEAVVGVELQQNKDIILKAVRDGVEMLAHEKQPIEILLNPDDMMIVKAKYNDEFLEEQEWRLIADPSIDQAGCIVRNPSSVVDLTDKNRLSSVMDSFLQGSGIESGN